MDEPQPLPMPLAQAIHTGLACWMLENAEAAARAAPFAVTGPAGALLELAVSVLRDNLETGTASQLSVSKADVAALAPGASFLAVRSHLLDRVGPEPADERYVRVHMDRQAFVVRPVVERSGGGEFVIGAHIGAWDARLWRVIPYDLPRRLPLPLRAFGDAAESTRQTARASRAAQAAMATVAATIARGLPRSGSPRLVTLIDFETVAGDDGSLRVRATNRRSYERQAAELRQALAEAAADAEANGYDDEAAAAEGLLDFFETTDLPEDNVQPYVETLRAIRSTAAAVAEEAASDLAARRMIDDPAAWLSSTRATLEAAYGDDLDTIIATLIERRRAGESRDALLARRIAVLRSDAEHGDAAVARLRQAIIAIDDAGRSIEFPIPFNLEVELALRLLLRLYDLTESRS